MKRQLNEQWVEELDGKKHMLKAVEGKNCTGCAFGKMFQGSRLNNIHVCDREDDCPLEYSDTVVKDLGILNEDGLLPCPFCGEYPVVQPENSRAGFGCHCDKCKCAVSGLHESMQEVMDEWNRRA